MLRASKPENLSYPLKIVEGTITRPNLFFVRDHFDEPEVSLDRWNLRIDGAVARPFELGFSDLAEMPSKKIRAVLECAGNAAGGSAVSCGEWEGVPLSMLLERSQPSADAAFVMLEGADSGRLFQDSPPLPYSQIVPIAKCREPESLIAYKLNDLTLPARNGFPARALFPGWYGMDSVKWLQRITVLRPSDRGTIFQQSGMNRIYNRVARVNGALRTTRLSGIQVKSAVAWPSDGAKLPAGKHVIWGFAWSGAEAIRTVSASLDGGRNWSNAGLENRPDTYGWVRWRYEWSAQPGDYILMSRASDQGGNTQPLTRDPARRDGYELNWCVPLHCSVR
ncbi:MAG: molybdopterin-dependent oxidoreductase [Bryobacteraceae bacterium]